MKGMVVVFEGLIVGWTEGAVGYIRVGEVEGTGERCGVARRAAARRGWAGRLVAEVHVVPAGSSESRACHGPHGGPLCVCVRVCVCVGQPCPTFDQ